MKKIMILLFLGFTVFTCFAERQTRVDRHGNCQVKHIWDANYTNGPDNSNHAKGWSNDFDSILSYLYYINPKRTQDNTDAAMITIFSDKNGHPYRYMLQVSASVDGVNQDLCVNRYFPEQYNLVKRDFDSWVNYYEQFVR